MFKKKYSNYLFTLIVGSLMSLLMTILITFINTGFDDQFFYRFFKAWVISLPIAICAILIVGPFARKLTDKLIN